MYVDSPFYTTCEEDNPKIDRATRNTMQVSYIERGVLLLLRVRISWNYFCCSSNKHFFSITQLHAGLRHSPRVSGPRERVGEKIDNQIAKVQAIFEFVRVVGLQLCHGHGESKCSHVHQ